MEAQAIPTLYKIVGVNGEPLNGGSGLWPMPSRVTIGPDGPGEWREIAGDLRACHNGLHLTDAANLSAWLPSSAYGNDGTPRFTVLRAEVDGECYDAGQKWVARKVRLLPRREPMPDILAATVARDDARDTANMALGKANALRLKRQDRAIRKGGAWAEYLRGIGSAAGPLQRALPDGHPAHAAVAAYSAADAAYRKAKMTYNRAIDRADAAYDAALAPIVEGA